MRCLPPGRRPDRPCWRQAARSGFSSTQWTRSLDTAPALPILDVPVPLMEEQLVDVLRFFDMLCPVAEHAIDVPKISLEDIPARRLCREPQLVEQLVEVPTFASYSSFFAADCGAARRSSSSWCRSLTFLVEVFKVYALFSLSSWFG